MQSKVSMIIPCYNKFNYIGKTFDSVLAQKWDNIELILVNDGSTDGTRDVITVYEPKFISRGYELTIIDQENQGCCAAIKAGLLRMTGEYVCMPDCDDRLDVEYVSAMVEWLESHTEFNVVVCDADNKPYDFESSLGLKRLYDCGYDYYPYRLIESTLVSARVNVATWAGLYRSVFLLEDCKILSMDTNNKYTQDAQFSLRIAKNSTKIGWIHRILYYFNEDESKYSTMGFNRMKSVKSYILSRAQDMLNVIEKCNFNSLYVDIVKIITPLLCLMRHPEPYSYAVEQIQAIICNIEESGMVDSDIVKNMNIKPDNLSVFHRALSSALIGYTSSVTSINRKPNGKIIAYAVLGRGARDLLPHLINSNLRPDEFWDVEADGCSNFHGFTVTPPDFERLSKNDTVLVFLKNAKIAREVSVRLESTSASGNIYYHYDILDYTAQLLFPEISTETILIKLD